MLIVECETLYREVYYMTQEQLDAGAFDEAALVVAEALETPDVQTTTKDI